MLTDEELHELIDPAAAAAPQPAPLPDDLFRAEPRPAKRRSYRLVIVAIAAAFVAVLAGTALLSGNTDRKGSSAAGPTRSAAATTVVPIEAQITSGAAAGGAGGGAGGTGAGTGTPAEGSLSSPVQAQVPPIADSAKIVKNGSLEIRVGKGTVTESVNRLTALATGLGGYVSETRTTASSQSGAQATATISLRVPAAAFEQLVAEASKLGEVRSTTTSGQDVTAQFTDIEAQLKALTATRDQFLLVLGEANNVGDILAVQDRITQVQIQIDQLEGQKRLLTDQTSFGTLSITLLEPGATVAVPPIDDNKDLGDAWRDARRNFGDGIENIVEASGTLAVVFLGAAVTLSAAWMIYRRMRRQII